MISANSAKHKTQINRDKINDDRVLFLKEKLQDGIINEVKSGNFSASISVRPKEDKEVLEKIFEFIKENGYTHSDDLYNNYITICWDAIY